MRSSGLVPCSLPGVQTSWSPRRTRLHHIRQANGPSSLRFGPAWSSDRAERRVKGGELSPAGRATHLLLREYSFCSSPHHSCCLVAEARPGQLCSPGKAAPDRPKRKTPPSADGLGCVGCVCDSNALVLRAGGPCSCSVSSVQGEPNGQGERRDEQHFQRPQWRAEPILRRNREMLVRRSAPTSFRTEKQLYTEEKNFLRGQARSSRESATNVARISRELAQNRAAQEVSRSVCHLSGSHYFGTYSRKGRYTCIRCQLTINDAILQLNEKWQRHQNRQRTLGTAQITAAMLLARSLQGAGRAAEGEQMPRTGSALSLRLSIHHRA